MNSRREDGSGPPAFTPLNNADESDPQAAGSGEKPSGSEKGWCAKQCDGLKVIMSGNLNVMLICVPLGVVSKHYHWGCGPTFLINFLAIIPLAAVLGASTEALAGHVGQTLGGLLNATFGNAVEMIVTIEAIMKNQVHVVQMSLIGSILSNLLLVLGCAFCASGLKTKSAAFNATGATTNISCLVLSSLALTLPTVFAKLPDIRPEDEVNISRIVALVMAFVYVMFLVFQLKTHADLFVAEEGEEEQEEAPIAASTGMFMLFLCTVAVTKCSEYLVEAIDPVVEQYEIPQAFIGLILLPIVGNAAEHTTAITAAYKGMMDLALGIAVGSSTQIALFVIPFSVIIGWCVDVDMSLNFEIFETTVFLLSVFIASGILSDGFANWFEGFMLVATYIIVAIITWFIPSDQALEAAAIAGGGAKERRLIDTGLALLGMAPAEGSGGVPSVFV